jgi:heme/copper-type cytochrome/quinol oxidase subunit 1
MVLGSAGMPRGYAAYLERFASLQRVASLGALVMIAGLLLVVVSVYRPVRRSNVATAS